MATSLLERIQAAKSLTPQSYQTLANSPVPETQANKPGVLQRVKTAIQKTALQVKDATTLKPKKALIAPLTPAGERYVKNIKPGSQIGKEPDVVLNSLGIPNAPYLELDAALKLKENKNTRPDVLAEAKLKEKQAYNDFALNAVGSVENLGSKAFSKIAKSTSIDEIAGILKTVLKDKSEGQLQSLSKVLANTSKPEKVRELVLSQQKLSDRIKLATGKQGTKNFADIDTVIAAYKQNMGGIDMKAVRSEFADSPEALKLLDNAEAEVKIAKAEKAKLAKREREYGEKLNALANKTKVLSEDGSLDTKSISDFQKAEYELAKEYPDLGINQDKIAYYEKTKGINKVDPIIQEAPKVIDDVKPLVSQKEAPQAAPQVVQAKSVEEQAGQVLSKADPEIKKDIVSLPKIVQEYPTNVKNKVNLLDYIRTPDRVLEKIGMKAEADKIRKGYEAYVKELPDNLDIITKWSQRVPKESNKKIFQYLDGQEVELDKTELEVAGEIKDWLSDWAKRLKLPEDNRIAHYITHIFEKGLIQKEFDEDLAKIISERIPGSVYDPFLLKRLGAKGYKEDTWAALDAYVKRATRKANLDDALEAISEKTGGSLEFSSIEESQFKYVQRYINNVNLRPTELDNLIDNGVKSLVGYKFGQRPMASLTRTLRQVTFRGMLGLNPASALRNLSQGVNTYAVLGEKYTALGYAKLFNSNARKELVESGIFDNGFIQDRALNATKKNLERLDKVLFSFFDAAEKINRGAAYLGAKAKALSKGKTEEESAEYAKEIVRKTQFSFGSIDTPVALQSDIAKTLTQFQTYTVKQIEFLTEMAKDKNFAGLLRYALGGLAFTYTIGKAFGMKPEQLIPSFRFDTPPSLKLPVEVGKAALNTPDKYGKQRSLSQKAKDIGNSAIGLVPAGSQIKKTVQGIDALRQGKSTDKAGRAQFDVGGSMLKDAQAALFGKYANKEAQNYFKGDTYAEQQYEKLKKSPTAEEDFARIIKEDPKLANRINKVIEDIDLEVTKDEQRIRSLGVGDGARAAEVVKKLDKLKTQEEKAALYDEYIKKKIITKEVGAQIQLMMTDTGRNLQKKL